MRQTFKTEAERQDFIQRSRAEGAAIRAAKLEVADAFRLWLRENKLGTDFVRDTAMLPFKKHVLEYALLHAIANESVEETACELVECLLNLAHYQDGVGEAVTLPDFDADDWMELHPREALKHLIEVDMDKLHVHKTAIYRERTRLAKLGGSALDKNVLLVGGYKKLWQRIRKRGQFSPHYRGHVHFPTAQPHFEITDFQRKA